MKKGLACSLMFVLVACGGGDSPGVDGGDGDGDGDGDAGGEDWQVLLEGDWTLDGLEEGYYCVYATVPRDLYVKAFRPMIPDGTHHTVLTLYDGATPADGTYPCNAGTNGQNMIYGSGVGSPDFFFPDGVGLHLQQGQRLLLNLHLYNASDVSLDGTSGSLFLEATAAEIQNEAEVVLAGPTFALNVPTGVTTQQGTCQVSNITSEPIQVWAVSPHMHKLGRHMRSVVTRGDQEIVIQDVDYDFEQQVFHRKEPHVELLPGDVVTTYCTYENTPETNPPSGAPVSFGDSSDDEMCFTDLFYYPAQGADFICTF